MDYIEFKDIIGNKFKLYMNPADVPDDGSNVYVISKEGLLCRITNDLGTFWRSAKEIPSLPSANVAPAKLHFKKIPKKQLDMAATFFKDIYALLGTESMVRIYETSGGNRFADAPPQTVTSVKVEHKDNRKEKIVLDIHSHGSMGAFFSGEDDDDENAFRFFGVAGKVDTNLELLFRLKFDEVELKIKMSDIFEGIGNGYQFKRVAYPSSWLKKVQKREYVHTSGFAGYSGFGGVDRRRGISRSDPLYDFEQMEFFDKGKRKPIYNPVGKKRMDKLINAFLDTHFDVQSQIYDLFQEILYDPSVLRRIRYMFKKLSIDEVKEFLDEVEENSGDGFESKTPDIKLDKLEKQLEAGKLQPGASGWMTLWKARPDLQEKMLENEFGNRKLSSDNMKLSESPEGLNHLDDENSRDETGKKGGQK